MIPLGRGGTPDEAAGAVYLFCIPESNYISGQTHRLRRRLHDVSAGRGACRDRANPARHCRMDLVRSTARRRARDCSATRCAASSRPSSSPQRGALARASSTSTATPGARPASSACCCAHIPDELRRRRRRRRATRRSSTRSSRAAARWASASTCHDIVAHYILAYGTEAQKQRWLPQMASGEPIARDRDDRAGRRLRPAGHPHRARSATATTTSSTARRRSSPTATSPTWCCWSCKTDPQAGAKGISLIMVETDGPAGLPARPHPGQDRAEGAGHRRAVLRRRPRAGGEPARRRGGARLRPADAAAAVRAHDHRRVGGRRRSSARSS